MWEAPRDLKITHCILYSSLSDIDWPDELDLQTGRFTYYGDNKTPGNDLHGTTRSGNVILRDMFDCLHGGKRNRVPPVFVFSKGASGREVIFRGLAVPGALGLGQRDDLVAVWKSTSGRRFQNYKAVFTILDEPVISRAWVNRVRGTTDLTVDAPPTWLKWQRSGIYTPLQAPRTREYRTPREQLPNAEADLQLLRTIVDFYSDHADGVYGFERCAAAIFRLLEANVISIDLTRPWRDGGRDALGKYKIGHPPAVIAVEFALEAKCKAHRLQTRPGSERHLDSFHASDTGSSEFS